MDKNKDGVVTLEEFIIACQEVCIVLYLSCLLLSVFIGEYMLEKSEHMLPTFKCEKT